MGKGNFHLRLVMLLILSIFFAANASSSDAAYDDSSFDGAWISTGADSFGEFDFYVLSDGNGNLADAGFNNFLYDELSNYNVSADGSMILNIHREHDGVMTIPCQLTSSAAATCTVEEDDGPDMVFDLVKVGDVSGMHGVWTGTLGAEPVNVSVSDDGTISSVIGVKGLVYGKLYAQDGRVVGFMRTAVQDGSQFRINDQIQINGTLEHDTADLLFKNEGDEEESIILTRVDAAGPPSSIQIPAHNITGSYQVSWGSSITTEVTYVLEESTDPGFAAEVTAVVYTGPNVSVPVTGKTDGTYYYRVKAVKDGQVDSDWRVADTGCDVNTLRHEEISVDDFSDWMQLIGDDGYVELLGSDRARLAAGPEELTTLRKEYSGSTGVFAEVLLEEMTNATMINIRTTIGMTADGNEIQCSVRFAAWAGHHYIMFQLDEVDDSHQQHTIYSGTFGEADSFEGQSIEIGLARIGDQVHIFADGFGYDVYQLDGVQEHLNPEVNFYVWNYEDTGLTKAVFSNVRIIYPVEQEFTDSTWVSAFYVAYWNRAGDPEGMDYWLDMIDSGALDATGVAENFAMLPEGKESYPYFNSPETATDEDRTVFLQTVYQNLLNRNVPANDEGIVYWVGELREGRTTPGAVIGNIIHAAIQLDGQDWQTIWNKTLVAQYYTEKFRETGQEWTREEHRAQAMEVMQDVTSDPASVIAGRAKVDQLLP